jgi:PAS domain S-box-containing protein
MSELVPHNGSLASPIADLTNHLAQRATRSADWGAENRAIHALLREAPKGWHALATRLAHAARELCAAEAAGIFVEGDASSSTTSQPPGFCVAEEGEWHALLHSFAAESRAAVRVVSRPLDDAPPREVLLLAVPASRDRRGVLWVAGKRLFDREDLRALSSLSDAYQQLTTVLAGNDAISSAHAASVQATRQCEERLRQICDSNLVNVIFFDFSGRILQANDAFLRLVEYSRDELLAGAIRWDRLTPPEWMPRTKQAMEEIRLHGRCMPYEKQYIRRNGSRFWGLFSGAKVGDGSEGLAFILDMTARRQAEQAAQDNSAMLERAQRVGGMGHWVFNTDTGEVTCSPQAREIFVGDADVELNVEALLKLMHPDDSTRLIAEAQQAIAESHCFAADCRITRPDGSRRTLYLEADLDRGGDGRPATLLGVVQDITERRRDEEALKRARDELELRVQERTAELAAANEALRESNQAISALFRASPLAIISLDATGLVKSWNPAAEKTFGWKEGEVLGHPLPKAPASGDEPEQPFITTELFAGSLAGIETKCKVRNGSQLDVAVWTAPVVDTRGALVATIALVADVSERKRNERARTELLRRIVTAQEDERRRIARELHDQMGQLLAALMLGLKALEGLPADSSQFREKLQQQREIVDQIGKEVHDLALQLRPTALDDLGLQVALAQHVETWSQRTKVESDVHCSGLENGRLAAELETAVYRMVQEALTNVAKHARATRVSVILERRNEQLLIIVEDNGIGFRAEQVKHSRQVLRRLGLLGMQERLASVGGDLEIESSVGQGTTVFGRVPLNKRKE